MRHDRDAQPAQLLVDVHRFDRVARPRRRDVAGRDQRDLMAGLAQLLREQAAQVELLGVVDHDRPGRRQLVRHDVVRREDLGLLHAGDRHPVAAAVAVAPPGRAGRQHHALEAELQHVLGRQPAVAIERDVGHLLDLQHAVVAHPRPGRQPRQAQLLGDAPAKLGRRLRQMHLVAALAQRPRRLQPRRPGADDQHAILRPARADHLRMPALAPFLAHGRILGAAHRRDGVVAADADVAADAFADVFEPAFLDLPGQERIGDRRPRRADHVEHAALDLRDHGVGRGEAADADDGLGGQRLHEGDELLLVALLREARAVGIELPVADVDVPQVRQLGQHRDHVARLALRRDAVRPHHLVGREPHRDAAGVADRVLGILDHLAEQPHAVLQAAAIFVGAGVAAALQEVHGQRQVMPGIDVDDIVSGLARADRRLAVPAAEVADVLAVHGARLERVVARHLVDRPDRHLAAVEVGGGRAVVIELDRRQRAVLVHRLAHQRVVRDVVVVPQPRLDERRHVAGGMDLALLGRDHRPAALRLHPAHGGMGVGMRMPHAVAMRHLEEPVLGGDRPDADRLEQDVVTRIARHGSPQKRSSQIRPAL